MNINDQRDIEARKFFGPLPKLDENFYRAGIPTTPLGTPSPFALHIAEKKKRAGAAVTAPRTSGIS